MGRIVFVAASAESGGLDPSYDQCFMDHAEVCLSPDTSLCEAWKCSEPCVLSPQTRQTGEIDGPMSVFGYDQLETEFALA